MAYGRGVNGACLSSLPAYMRFKSGGGGGGGRTWSTKGVYRVRFLKVDM